MPTRVIRRLRNSPYADRMPMGQRQLVKFVLIGMLAVVTDMVAYFVFLNVLPESTVFSLGNEALAKTLSFLCGLAVTYNLNKRWTWRRSDRSSSRLAKFGALYGVSLLINVAANQALLAFFVHLLDWRHGYLLSFLGATVTCSVWNFVGQKFWVFRDRQEQLADTDRS